MSATITTAADEPATIDLSSTPPVWLSRLVRVELRKALDTRAGFWFTISIVGLCLAAVTFFALVTPDDELAFADLLEISGAVLGYFLPVLIILLVTSESGQRTGLVTFSLEPRRSRVVQAKLGAGLILTLVVMAVAVVMSVVGTLVGTLTGGSASWDVNGLAVLNVFVIGNILAVLVGFMLALLLMNTPAAIVGYFAYGLILPTIAAILGSVNQTIDAIVPWVEFNTAQVPLFQAPYSPTGQEWLQIAVTGTIWLVVPLALGIMRLLRTEFK